MHWKILDKFPLYEILLVVSQKLSFLYDSTLFSHITYICSLKGQLHSLTLSLIFSCVNNELYKEDFHDFLDILFNKSRKARQVFLLLVDFLLVQKTTFITDFCLPLTFLLSLLSISWPSVSWLFIDSSLSNDGTFWLAWFSLGTKWKI